MNFSAQILSLRAKLLLNQYAAAMLVALGQPGCGGCGTLASGGIPLPETQQLVNHLVLDPVSSPRGYGSMILIRSVAVIMIIIVIFSQICHVASLFISMHVLFILYSKYFFVGVKFSWMSLLCYINYLQVKFSQNTVISYRRYYIMYVRSHYYIYLRVYFSHKEVNRVNRE